MANISTVATPPLPSPSWGHDSAAHPVQHRHVGGAARLPVGPAGLGSGRPDTATVPIVAALPPESSTPPQRERSPAESADDTAQRLERVRRSAAAITEEAQHRSAARERPADEAPGDHLPVDEPPEKTVIEVPDVDHRTELAELLDQADRLLTTIREQAEALLEAASAEAEALLASARGRADEIVADARRNALGIRLLREERDH